MAFPEAFLQELEYVELKGADYADDDFLHAGIGHLENLNGAFLGQLGYHALCIPAICGVFNGKSLRQHPIKKDALHENVAVRLTFYLDSAISRFFWAFASISLMRFSWLIRVAPGS